MATGGEVSSFRELRDQGRVAVLFNQVEHEVERELVFLGEQKRLLTWQGFKSTNAVGFAGELMVILRISKSDIVHIILKTLVQGLVSGVRGNGVEEGDRFHGKRFSGGGGNELIILVIGQLIENGAQDLVLAVDLAKDLYTAFLLMHVFGVTRRLGALVCDMQSDK